MSRCIASPLLMRIHTVASGVQEHLEQFLKANSFECCSCDTLYIRDLFHVYLNKCEFHFSRLHVNKKNNFCFLLNNGHVPCMTK